MSDFKVYIDERDDEDPTLVIDNECEANEGFEASGFGMLFVQWLDESGMIGVWAHEYDADEYGETYHRNELRNVITPDQAEQLAQWLLRSVARCRDKLAPLPSAVIH